MNLRFIVMTTGYVENASTAVLIYQCRFFGRGGFSSYKEAITELATDMYGKFYDDHLSIYENRYGRDVKKCCREVLIADKNAKFCSTCGSQISDKEFDAQEFMEYVCGLMNTTCDSYGEAEWTSQKEHMAWWPYWVGEFIGAPKEEVIYMAENAEVTLLAALLEAKPELKNDSADDVNETHWGDWDDFRNERQPSYH
jgi:hypothetical protein